MDRRELERRNREVQAMLERVRPMLVKLVKRRVALGEGLFGWDELWELAEDAVKDGVLTFDATKAKWSTYAHYQADWAMLDALEKVASRERLPEVQRIKALYEHAQGMSERGNPLYDTDEQTETHLSAALDELAGVFGAHVGRSPEEETASHEAASAVHAALGEMSEYQANIVRLRHMLDQTLEETGRALGASTSEVYRDEPKALIQLQAILRRRGVVSTGPSGPPGAPSDLGSPRRDPRALEV